MWPNLQFRSDLVTFTKEILNEKLHFLCSDISLLRYKIHCSKPGRSECDQLILRRSLLRKDIQRAKNHTKVYRILFNAVQAFSNLSRMAGNLSRMVGILSRMIGNLSRMDGNLSRMVGNLSRMVGNSKLKCSK